MSQQVISFSLSAKVDQKEVSPAHVTLDLLRSFSDEVATFIVGSDKNTHIKDLPIAIEHGSLKLVLPALVMSASLLHDWNILSTTQALTNMDPKRIEVVTQKWQNKARKDENYSVQLQASQMPTIQIDGRSHFYNDEATQWVAVERYIQGEVMTLGGVTKPNLNVKLSNGKTLTVAASQAVLKADTENRIYRNLLLRVRGQQHLQTNEYKNLSLINYVDYAPQFDATAFDQFTQQGKEAWRGISSASAWVEELRGA
jgi:hypothetical protein